ncbi:MAG: FecR domain-containing protein [Cyclobacteriaceae bacterium]
MAKTKSIIDIEIIFRKFNGSISTEEEDLLNQWLQEDKKHQRYFENALQYFENGSNFEDKQIDSNEAWAIITGKINKPGSRRSWKVFRVAASLAATVSLVFATIFIFNSIKEEVKPAPVAQKQVITPGESKATLILDDGTTYDLSKGEKVQLKSGGAKIQSEGTRIEYSQDSQDSQKTTYNSLLIPKGGEFYVELSDGTKVWLNSATKFKYPTSFSEESRIVELSGEAYFEVARDENKPFLVTSGDQTIKVLGTQFNISAYDDDESIVTTLVEGKVNVFNNRNGQKGEDLLPNAQSTMSKRTGEISQKIVDPNDFIAWKSGSFYFNDRSLEDMMKVLARWYDIDVFYDNDNTRQVKFTGGFKRYDQFESVKRLIEKTNEAKFKINGKAVLIK